MEQEQLEDSSEQNNTVPDARPEKGAVLSKSATINGIKFPAFRKRLHVPYYMQFLRHF